jgi:FtsP/CotA-like multicopper oxidase with cupredoxin domain
MTKKLPFSEGPSIESVGSRLKGLLSWRAAQSGCLGIILSIPLPAVAQVKSPELIQPPICSATTAAGFGPNGICSVRPLGGARNEVTIALTAGTSSVKVAGYTLVTENYNGAYVTPVVEAMPGDTIAAHLVNLLQPRPHDGMTHGDADENPTNLHYFHGGIVSPNNARPKPAELGNGDNIYVHLKAGATPANSNSFDFQVPIPGEQGLDARVLEGQGYITHPLGLNWYHSHLHGISSDQVMGGMSGLLSVGEPTANIKAGCLEDPNDNSKCLNDLEKDTAVLKANTKVRYVILRDLPVQKISKRPEEAEDAAAEWAPASRDFPVGTKCGVWNENGTALDSDNAKLRRGFCQRDRDTAWLFTLNGERFPTITVEGGKNILLRLGNLSANVGYWLELYNEADGTVLPLTILSLDGVVPAKPVSPELTTKPVVAINVNDVLLMLAARAEIYVRNDETTHTGPTVYILRTKALRGIGADEWPEIQLARVVLEPNSAASKVAVALNVPISKVPTQIAAGIISEKATLPEGCIRDLDPTANEYRRVILVPGGQTSTGQPTDWSIQTEIPRPEGSDLKDEGDHMPADPSETTIEAIPFEDYVLPNGLIDWTKRHVCILIDHGSHKGSHKQLWALFNATDSLHNFHIHQMKFRLATTKELEEHHIMPPMPSHTCDQIAGPCTQPDYKFYDEDSGTAIETAAAPIWHDTIPLPPVSKVFIIMSFDASQQIGRFVFHCHILKHEDHGLMAPIEVWEPTSLE